MRFVGRFVRFWYDFIIGEDWRIAAGVAVALGLGAGLVVSGQLSDHVITLLVLGLIVLGLLMSFVAETRNAASRDTRAATSPAPRPPE